MANKYNRYGTELAEGLGKLFAEAFFVENKEADAQKEFTEKYGISLKEGMEGISTQKLASNTFKEDITTSNSSATYTTMLSDTLMTAALDQMEEILGLTIVFNDLKNANGGYGAYKIALGLPTKAAEISEGEVINYFSEGAQEIVITPTVKAVGTAITWQMLKRGMPDYIKWIGNNAVNAIKRKLTEDILSALNAGVDSGNVATGGVTYDKIVDAIAAVRAAETANGVPYGFMPSDIVLSPTAFATLQKSTDWKEHVYRAVVVPGQPEVVNRPIEYFDELRIHKSPFIPTGCQALIVDKNYALAYVPESDVETFEGQLPGRPFDRELVALLSYGQAVLYPKSIYAIRS